MKRNFVKYISHEVRTPLNIVLMGTQLAISKLNKTPDGEHIALIMNDVLASCQVSIDVLNDLLLFDKLENGNLELEKKETTVWDIVNNNAKLFVVQVQQVTHNNHNASYSTLYNIM
jgi:signal transduction histidine kinase